MRRSPIPELDTCDVCGELFPDFKLKYGRKIFTVKGEKRPRSKLVKVCDKHRKGIDFFKPNKRSK